MTLAEVIERIKQEAISMSDDEAKIKRVLDREVFIELILPKCIQEITKQALQHDDKVGHFRADITVAITAGVGNLPAGVEEDFLDHIWVSAPATTASRERERYDYFESGDILLDTFYISEGKLYYREANTKFDDYTGNVTLSVIKTPQLPSLISDTITIDASILEDLIFFTACVVSGRIPAEKLGLSI